ncbi:MAG TPA: VIT1/CCC1 transporter family protein [Acidobacteriaceae bacterium]|jgi:VIT1/CCC1 family predicted Fe2+/Mn2+ transporter
MHDIAREAPGADHVEGHFESSESVRDVVIGLSDGLTVPFALAAGLSGAVSSAHIIVLAGLAEIAAGSIAMGLGGYLAARGDAEHYASELKREQTEVITRPDDEAEEIYQIFDQYAVPREAAAPVLAALQRNHPAYVDFMMRFELGLEKPAENRAHRSALTIACSYVAGGLVPLLPYMFVRAPWGPAGTDIMNNPLIPTTDAALKFSVLITLLALAFFGALKGRLLGTGTVRSALQTTLIGGAAAAAAYTLAHLLNHA